MITVGLDFGTHQTKVCFERMENGTPFYEVFRFNGRDGKQTPTLPSFVRELEDGTLRYGHDAVPVVAGSRAITYFKQMMFSWGANDANRKAAEVWSVLFLAFVVFKMDQKLRTKKYVVQMGMPTDADPGHHEFCRRQAMKVMASAMLIVRNAFRDDLEEFLSTPSARLKGLAEKCMEHINTDIREARKDFPVFVFPEAYASLIPLIKEHKLPQVGPNLFVDIGGGTVDISFFTSQEWGLIGEARPCLYYYHSAPFGLNKIVGFDIGRSHEIEVRANVITRQCVDRFRQDLTSAVARIMNILKNQYVIQGRTSVMPFATLCRQILDGRPICYSGGGSTFGNLRIPVASRRDMRDGVYYNFSDVRSVSALIDHSKLYVKDEIFHVLATAFALSHQSLQIRSSHAEPDAIKLVSVGKLFEGIKLPSPPMQTTVRRTW